MPGTMYSLYYPLLETLPITINNCSIYAIRFETSYAFGRIIEDCTERFSTEFELNQVRKFSLAGDTYVSVTVDSLLFDCLQMSKIVR